MSTTAMNVKKVVHVVVGVVFDPRNYQRLLIAKRQGDQHQAGKWEFPGGKREAQESVKDALARELYEELGIKLETIAPLIKIRHDYPDKSVLLDVWRVTKFSGEAFGKEGQPIAWVILNELSDYEFPEANQAIIKALHLPNVCQITPEPTKSKDFMAELEKTLQTGIQLVQFRSKRLSNADYLAMAREAIALSHDYGAKLMLNSPPVWLPAADGLHLSSVQLLNTPYRPLVERGKWVSASCHNAKELEQAAFIQADFALLSPVKATRSHPDQQGIGWETFAAHVETMNIPIYALGGMQVSDLSTAQHYGAQGIAAISGYWQS
ncbi:MAG: Nudix family hydrolase [bacterium]